MKLYRLEFVLREPSEETEGMYLAEVPALPGCRAWGKTAALALEDLQSVTTAFIESHRAHGDPLPPEVAAAAVDVGGQSGVGEVWSPFDVPRPHAKAPASRLPAGP